MIRRIPPFPIGSLVRLSDGRPGVVVKPNFNQPCRPSVRGLEAPEPTGAKAKGGQPAYWVVDLGVTPELHITEFGGHDVQQYLFELPKHIKGSHATAA